MTIGDVVDLERFKYVMPYNLRKKTPWGTVSVGRGFMSDGASGVMDLDKDAFFCHDSLYLLPQVNCHRASRLQCDLIYGWLLMKSLHPIAAVIRPIGLQLFAGRKSWKRYRRLEKEDPNHWIKHFVPKEACWEFPSHKLEDAFWVGVEPLSAAIIDSV